jgi:hypothetical protein
MFVGIKRSIRSADSGSAMRDASLLQLAARGRRERYRVEVLPNRQLCERGIAYGDPANRSLLQWNAIQRALAAEVGEPEGVRTIIFDLVVDRISQPEGLTFAVRRLDAEPGEEAMAVARAIETALEPEAVAPSIKSLSAEGTPSLRYQDLEEFEAAALHSLADG